ncbi:GAF domain-containing protein [Sorangium sp. So ce136]|uniref:GAF domain-containing protein n=1 Tax=Sorangium sp. So ce136 TaxID=3133284 RepID=UPI003F0794B2
MHARRESLEPWLRSFIAESGGIAGTVHLVEGEALALAAAVNIPEKVQEVTRVVPRGKGMAGLAWERGQPVQTCNLQTDSSGDVRPGARAVAAQAAVALPVRDASAGVRAVVGIAFADERELDQEELARLGHGAGALPA